jgi:hypothetical protein
MRKRKSHQSFYFNSSLIIMSVISHISAQDAAVFQRFGITCERLKDSYGVESVYLKYRVYPTESAIEKCNFLEEETKFIDTFSILLTQLPMQ